MPIAYLLLLLFLLPQPAVAQAIITRNVGNVQFTCWAMDTDVVITATNLDPPDQSCTAGCAVTKPDGSPAGFINCTNGIPAGTRNMTFCDRGGATGMAPPPYSNPTWSPEPSCGN